MQEFLSWRSYWVYSKSIRQKNRYIYSKKVEKFFQLVLETYKDRTFLIKTGTILWRAQLGHDWVPLYQDRKAKDFVECHMPPTRMKPMKDQALEGRINPKGIPCLYLSIDRETAMSEVRPWVSSQISVGQFEIIKDLKLVDCSIKSKNIKFYLNEPSGEKKRESVMSDIDSAFTKPVTNNDAIAEYAPTQILGELFKNNGFDGIVYSSALGIGKNIALFNINNARQLNCLF